MEANMKKIMSIMIITVFIAGGLSAQNMMHGGFGGPGGPMDGPQKDKKHCISDQPYYQYMVFRMTEVLELTPEQAEKLFPLNRPYRDAKHSLHMQMGALGEEAFKEEEINKSDLDKYKKEIARLHEEEAKLDDQFYSDVEKFLEPEQVVKLIFFDSYFRRELSNELKDRYDPGRNEKKGKKKFWEKRNK